ncbi:MAG: hypothetical protein ACREFQ_15910, partial [Stellaceae bacterium]
AAAPRPGSPRYARTRAVFDLARHPDARRLIADKAAFAAPYGLSAAETAALSGCDWRRLLQLGTLPNLLYKLYALHGNAPESFATAVKAAPKGE